MKALSNIMTGAGAAALIALSATPAQAEHRDRDRWDRRDGIDVGDIIQGVAILGGIAAVASALERDFGGYDDGYRGRYRDGYTNAVNSCGYEAERIARGRVRITDVDRTGNDRYRVRGVVEADYRGDRRYDWSDRFRSRYDRDREDFTCYARGNGRITDFNL